MAVWVYKFIEQGYQMYCQYLRPVSIALFSALLLNPVLSSAADDDALSLKEEQEAQILKQKFARELARLQKLEQQLNTLADEHEREVKAGDKIRAAQKKYAYNQLKKQYDASLLELQKLQRLYKSVESRRVNKEIAAQLSQDGEESASPTPEFVADKTVRNANQSQSVEALLTEEHALFNRKLILEAGVTYSHSDRKQLVLNGFLALDAIFLGNIALEGVETDIYRYDLSARYGLTDRINLNLNVPFIERSTNYQKGGAGTQAIAGEASVHRDPTLGDVTLGINYQVIKEGPNNPDVVWNLSVTAPTGEHPYGVSTVERPTDDPDTPTMEVPAELPTGSGVWAATTGFSVVRTLDPAIIFANLAYSYTEPESFDDIGIDPDVKQPGEVDLGNTWQFGMGIAFALNDRLSMNMSYSQAITRISKTRKEGEQWTNIPGSQANSANLGIGVTYAMTKHLSMVSTIGAGLTDDAPDLTLSFKFPYMF